VSIGLLLGLLAALGPLAIDLYVPGFPAVAHDLAATAVEVQLSMVSYFAALAFGPLVYGPITDRLGRRPPLFGGLALFALASLGCAAAPDIRWLIALRFLQGLGGCTGTTIARSIIRDLHSGAAAARLMATMYLVLGVSPVLAPLAGSLLLPWVGWRGLFVTMAVSIALAAALLAARLPETHGAERRTRHPHRPLRSDLGQLLRDGRYLQLVLASAGATASAFVFVAGAPFVFARHYALAPTSFSLLIGLNAAGQIIATQFAPLLMRRLGAARLLPRATLLAAGAGALLLLATLTTGAPLPMTVALCFAVACCVGLWLTPAAVAALDAHQSIAGTAAGLMSTAQVAVAALLTLLTGLLERGDGRGIAAGYLLCGGGAWLLCRRAFARYSTA